VIEGPIDELLAVGVGEDRHESLSELARLGARLIIQRAVEDEFDVKGTARRPAAAYDVGVPRRMERDSGGAQPLHPTEAEAR
jgi:hypothetical protein